MMPNRPSPKGREEGEEVSEQDRPFQLDYMPSDQARPHGWRQWLMVGFLCALVLPGIGYAAVLILVMLAERSR
jgi:hypothetical protein